MSNPAKPFLQVNRIKRHPGQSRVIWDTPFSFSNPLFLADLKSQLELGSETGNVEFNIGEFDDWDEIRGVDVSEFPTGTVMSASSTGGTFYFRWLLVPGGAPPENVPTVVVPTVPVGKYWKLISYHNVNDTETSGLLIPGGFVDLLGTGGVGGLLLNVTNITFVAGATALALPNDSTANTQVAGNNSTRIATTAFVSTAIANLVESSPGTLDTLDELAAALGDDANFAATTATALGNRLRIDTAAQGLNGTQLTNAATNLGIHDKIGQAATFEIKAAGTTRLTLAATTFTTTVPFVFSGGGVADTTLANLGGTTVGTSVFKVANPGAITYFRVNANNSVSLLSAATAADEFHQALKAPSVPVAANSHSGMPSGAWYDDANYHYIKGTNGWAKFAREMLP